jgi:hypothetical protein
VDSDHHTGTGNEDKRSLSTDLHDEKEASRAPYNLVASREPNQRVHWTTKGTQKNSPGALSLASRGNKEQNRSPFGM